jgi:hypothetical protein
MVNAFAMLRRIHGGHGVAITRQESREPDEGRGVQAYYEKTTGSSAQSVPRGEQGKPE